eukprot:CAMPEP_0172681702 /NCGR_PEP_ID=MMETSP1074-20121228/17649_1 /TAXON_ID=2916 /ORGANISM="Ceratium fusus, Strain PA161109" /LENGTH=168 /DNA_ID=CAMNT_0013500253 /DNA_START=442 /DNA_END=944 /DNA_ORIENTATION=+
MTFIETGGRRASGTGANLLPGFASKEFRGSLASVPMLLLPCELARRNGTSFSSCGDNWLWRPSSEISVEVSHELNPSFSSVHSVSISERAAASESAALISGMNKFGVMPELLRRVLATAVRHFAACSRSCSRTCLPINVGLPIGATKFVCLAIDAQSLLAAVASLGLT